MAIVVDTADGRVPDQRHSGEASINQSLTEPVFLSGLKQRIGTSADLAAIEDPAPAGRTGIECCGPQSSGCPKPVAGMLYYVGYNENFANYKSKDSDLA